MVGLVSRDTSGTDGVGSVLGTGVGVWFLASLSVTEFQLWIGISSRGGVFGVVAFYTPRERRLWVHLHWVPVWPRD